MFDDKAFKKALKICIKLRDMYPYWIGKYTGVYIYKLELGDLQK